MINRSESKLEYGHGLVQIDNALTLLKQLPPNVLPDALVNIDVNVFEINCNAPTTCRRGIYIRDLYQSEKPSKFLVQVNLMM